jgi:leucyl aminopeptidase
MKSIFAGLSLASLALAIPFYYPQSASDGNQVQLQLSPEDFADYPGFDLDLNELRLVQLEGRDPVWMTEYEKVGFGRPVVATPKLTLPWPE